MFRPKWSTLEERAGFRRRGAPAAREGALARRTGGVSLNRESPGMEVATRWSEYAPRGPPVGDESGGPSAALLA